MVSKRIWPTRTKDEREIQGFRRGQNDDNFEKANKVVGGVEDNIVTLTGDGDIKDSGISFDEVVLRDSNIVYPVNNYNIGINDEIIIVNCSISDIFITLPECNARTYVVQKIDSTAFKVVVSGQAGELINGNTTFELLFQYESIKPTKVNRVPTGS